MFMYLMLLLLPLLISSILIYLNYFLSMKSMKDREKPSPFECGFNPLTHARLPFSIHFFIIGIVFILFDIEIIALIPLMPSIKMNSNMFLWFTSMFFIMMILFIGLIYEWNEESIKWIN